MSNNMHHEDQAETHFGSARVPLIEPRRAPSESNSNPEFSGCRAQDVDVEEDETEPDPDRKEKNSEGEEEEEDEEEEEEAVFEAVFDPSENHPLNPDHHNHHQPHQQLHHHQQQQQPNHHSQNHRIVAAHFVADDDDELDEDEDDDRTAVRPLNPSCTASKHNHTHSSITIMTPVALSSDADKKKMQQQESEIRTVCTCETVSCSQESLVEERKTEIWRNVGLLTLGTHLNYAAYYGIGNLQILLNNDNVMYMTASKITLAFYAFSSYFFPTLFVNKIGLKRTVVVSFLFFMSYIVANYYANWYTLIPTAVLRGFGGGIVWSVKGVCLNTYGTQYAKLTGESVEYVVPRFFGIFFAGYQAAFITGIIISSFLIHKPESVQNYDTVMLKEECIAKYCYADIVHFFPDAANYTNVSDLSNIHSDYEKYFPDDYHTYLLYGVYTVLGILAVLVALFMTSDVRSDGTRAPPTVTPFSLVAASLRHLFKPFDILLLPSFLYIGVVDAFSGNDLSLGLIPCTSGVDNIGLGFTIFGVVSSLFSLASGCITKYTGRQFVFLFGWVCHLIVIIAMQHWSLDYSNPLTVFLVAGGWGIAAVILDIQISAFIGIVYPQNPAPCIANFILFQLIGNSGWRLFSKHMCLHVQLYVILTLLLASMIGYLLIEAVYRWRHVTFDLSESSSATDEEKTPEKETGSVIRY